MGRELSGGITHVTVWPIGSIDDRSTINVQYVSFPPTMRLAGLSLHVRLYRVRLAKISHACELSMS